MKKGMSSKLSKLRSCSTRATRPLGTAKVEVSESGDDPRSYPLTKVFKPRFIPQMRVTKIVVDPAAIPSLSRDRRRMVFAKSLFVRVDIDWAL
jgi:hypothetical protein